MIVYDNVHKRYDKNFEVVIRDLRLDANHIYAFLGENGAGKTTAIRMTLGLLKPSCGRILYDGIELNKNVLLKKKLGYVSDVPNLYESLTGFEQIQFISGLYGRVENEYIYELLDLFGIYEDKDQIIVKYSKGMKQKISIICALVHNPLILILDEPFTALDPGIIKKFKKYLNEFVKKEERLVLFSTHDLDAANTICTDAIIMRKGNIIQTFSELKGEQRQLEQLYFESIEQDVSKYDSAY
ncbi:ABC-2 type transport system ATP-binding protein [Lachnotalea glycerini]|uniref:ABC transporter ATP-binding protein n=1 Tax=Lachnotalea glycerini TaxID=1763509 RepID=A0A255IN89_9FIRM|nr:ABC transporter ATP-binding protein [Lachnotalea glycerini]PXV86005.1 ABC-2 type transport system ATP-binding protein [Lachnotalea glycerini]RDY30727.1 ABC transporter ATP-binding protein [Lachnotalea glycerini]